jgi:signal transduction histidine kinase
MEQHEKASGYLEKSLEIRERIGHHAGAAMSSLHLGLNYQAQKQYEPALHYLQKAVDLFRQAGYDMHYHTALYYQQQIYQLIGQYEQAAKLLGQVISFEKSFGNREALAEAYIAAAELHTQKNHGDSASYYLEEAKAVLMESGELESDPPLPGQWAAYHLAVSQLAEAQGNFQKALEHQALHFEIKERQDEARETKKIAEMEANYQLRVQKAQLELAETEKAALKQENKTIILISLITGFSLLLMVAAAWYIYRVRQRHIRQLTLNNAELENANHALERFVYSVSHDLKAPIASSRGLIELMRMEEPGAVVSEYLNMMEASMLKQEFFIKEVLDYSKNERLEISRNDIDFHTLIPELLDKFNHLPEAERVERLSFIEQEVPFVSDQSRVAVLLSNLITNGLRYHDPRKEQAYLKIEIRVDDEYAFVEISDNGLGIAEENQQKIFDMFYRAHDHKDGSGLGLYIVKETLRKLGGCISLYSREGEGTRFTFELPNLSKNQKEEIPKQPQTVKINAPVRD